METALSLLTSSAIPTLLQCLCFSLTIHSLLNLLLLPVLPALLLDSSFTKLLIFLLFLDLKVQDSYAEWFVYLAYGCCGLLGVYGWDAGERAGEVWVRRVRGWYWGQVGVGVLLAAVGLWGSGQGWGLAVMVGLVFGVNALRNRHVVFSVSVSALMLSLPLLRALTLPVSNLPMQYLPLCLSALLAQHQQQLQSLKNRATATRVYGQLLKMSIYFILYVELSGGRAYGQYILGLVAVAVGLARLKS